MLLTASSIWAMFLARARGLEGRFPLSPEIGQRDTFRVCQNYRYALSSIPACNLPSASSAPVLKAC
jgi:hypothetical protein